MTAQKEKKTMHKKSRFQCPFCGNDASNPKYFYSSLIQILAMRFTALLGSNNEKDQDYLNGILDSINAVFGCSNPAMKGALEASGYLEAFEQRHGKKDEGSEHKLKCDYCSQWKWDYLITIDDSKVARFICEECLSKKQVN